MKKIISLFLFLIVSLCHAQLQNLALLPTNSPIKITKNDAGKLKSICLNNNLSAPNNTLYSHVISNGGVILKINGEEYKGGLTAAINAEIIQLTAINPSLVNIEINPNYKEEIMVEIEIKKPISIAVNKAEINADNFDFITKNYPFALNNQIFYWKLNALVELGYLTEKVKLSQATTNFMHDFGILSSPEIIYMEVFYLRKLNYFENIGTLKENYKIAVKKFNAKFLANSPKYVSFTINNSKIIKKIFDAKKTVSKFECYTSERINFENVNDFIHTYKSKNDECLIIPTICISSNLSASFSIECNGNSLEISTDGNFSISATSDNMSSSIAFNSNSSAEMEEQLQFQSKHEPSKEAMKYVKLLQDFQNGKTTSLLYKFNDSNDFLYAYKATVNATTNTRNNEEGCTPIITLCLSKKSFASFELECNGNKINVSSSGSVSISSSKDGKSNSISFPN